ncbi:MAG: efflux RND transporter periplasmic adaptor subunit [Magnetococcales bacterium]|nr:efflux RND transporter periplasmic adaptor subunit [Magnetococcales bacterium]NGZ27545.1 efflux RND transporter periplasmic adaptor subunit [Magnetococcales bacterium]
MNQQPKSPIWRWLMGGILVAALSWGGWQLRGEPPAKEEPGKGKGMMGGGPTVVSTAVANTGSMSTRLEALGTVVPARLVTVRSRVDGQLRRIAFKEGEKVRAGDLLAEIDAKPFEIALAQMKGQLARDTALLENARNDAARYQSLLAKSSVSKQQLDTQLALVRQYQGAVEVDRALVENATLQLSYTRIVAPMDGVVGLRQVDEGNMIRQSEPGGLVTLAQVEPVQVVFTLAEDLLPLLRQYWQPGTSLKVQLFDRQRKNHLADGVLFSLDNQIDPTTGTVKLKAEFANQDHQLYPNQFVNVTLILTVRSDAILIPTAAIQRGRQGPFVYKVQEDQTVVLQMVKVGASEGEMTALEEGIQVGDKVVVEGTDKLRTGSKVVEAQPMERGRPSR